MSGQKRISIIDEVCRLRENSDYSIRKLASELGVSNQQISRWEKGHDKIPIHRAIAIANVLGVSEKEFWTRIDTFGQVVDYKSECKSLLSMLEESQLKALHKILIGLAYK